MSTAVSSDPTAVSSTSIPITTVVTAVLTAIIYHMEYLSLVVAASTSLVTNLSQSPIVSAMILNLVRASSKNADFLPVSSLVSYRFTSTDMSPLPTDLGVLVINSIVVKDSKGTMNTVKKVLS